MGAMEVELLGLSSSSVSVCILRTSNGNWVKLDSVVSLYYLCLLNLKQFQVCECSSHTPGCFTGLWVVPVTHCQKWTIAPANTAVLFRGQSIPFSSVLCTRQVSSTDTSDTWVLTNDSHCPWLTHRVIGRSVIFISRTRIKDTCCIHKGVCTQGCLKAAASYICAEMGKVWLLVPYSRWLLN